MADQMNRETQQRADESERRDEQQREDEQNKAFAAFSDRAAASVDDGIVIANTKQPKISVVKAGKVQSGAKVSITCSNKNAVIYYTATGWTPTTSSRRYTVPFSINTTTLVQAIAVAPRLSPSSITRANYTFKAPAIPVFPLSLTDDGVLHAGTRLHLVTSSTVSGNDANVGDKLSLKLDQDVKLGNTVMIPKGTPVDATITKVDQPWFKGTPGDLLFTVHSLTVNGITVPLKGGERLLGADHYTRVGIGVGVLMITVVGEIPFLLMHGDEAVIQLGMRFTVGVATDTPLKPSTLASTSKL